MVLLTLMGTGSDFSFNKHTMRGLSTDKREYQNYKANNIATFCKIQRGHCVNKYGFARNRFCFIFVEEINFS